MKIAYMVSAACALLIVATGCRTGGAKLPVNTTKYDYENSERFVLLDKGAQRSVTSPGIYETRTPEGRLEVVANLRNRENRRIQVQVNAEFKNAAGFTVESTPWRTVFLDENAQESVRFVSMNNEPVRYTIRVRQAR